MKKKKIFICGMSTECCSYSTLTQNKEDFEVISKQKLLAHIDFNWFLSQPWHKTAQWLETFKTSEMFNSVMKKSIRGELIRIRLALMIRIHGLRMIKED